MAEPPTRDVLTRFVFDTRRSAAPMCASRDLARDSRRPSLSPAVARVLAELLAASALLSSTLKFKGSLIVQLPGDGPVRLLVVECTDALEMRATAQWDACASAHCLMMRRSLTWLVVQNAAVL